MEKQNYLVLGLGITGWSMLRYLHGKGMNVIVADTRAEPPYLRAAREVYPNVDLYLGDFDLNLLANIDILAVSPGIDLNTPLLQKAREKNLKIIGDIELFAHAANAPIIGITGSNGKSTVTTLVGEILKSANKKIGIGGNLGTPALDLLKENIDFYVLELSSFQLELTDSLQCTSATILNITPDHIDRHGSVEYYGDLKQKIWNKCAHIVANQDDPDVFARAQKIAKKPDHTVHYFSLTSQNNIGAKHLYYLCENNLNHGENHLMPISALRIYGLHNAANALAAWALTAAVGIEESAIRTALKNFTGLPHRCQWIAERRGVQYINDSKGTNVGATLAALEGLDGPIVLLLGGLAKGGDFAPLVSVLNSKARAVLIYGADQAEIAMQMADLTAPVHLVEPDFEKIVMTAQQLAQSGDTVLLSPACASFDMFSGYAERGRKFAELVESLNNN